MIEAKNDTFTFGPFLLDVKERVLLRGSRPVSLTPKVFATLLMLVEKAGHIVEKDELIRALWPDTYVEEGNVAQNIFKLRQALGKNRVGKPYIETVPRRGYRFLAIVNRSPDLTLSPSVRPHRKASKELPESYVDSESRGIKSIAVLPLTNTSPDENLEYLSDGITESIISSLSRLPQLRVMARSSVFSYKGRDIDPKQVGRELQVETLLTGKVLQLSDCLVIRVELVDTSTGWQLWGEQYHQKPAGILEVQEEIAKEVSQQLSLKLSGEQKGQLIKRHTNNVEAYHLYLKGLFLWNKHEKISLGKSIRYFEKAIDLDPNYALAYAGLADCYQRLSNLTLAPRRALPKAKAAAAQAVALDDTLMEAHCAWAWIKMFYDHDWQGAERELKRAIELNPGAPLPHQRYGSYLTILGRFEESLSETRLAQELNPLGLQNSVNQASTFSLMKRHDEAISLLRQTLELEPNYRTAHYALGCVYRRQGNYAGALQEFEHLRRMECDSDLALGSIGHLLALSGDRVAAESILAELLEMDQRRYISPYSIAIIHIGLDNKEEAFNWMEKLYKECNDWLVWLQVGPEFDTLRSDARFDSLLRRVGFIT
jgi:TolB-like protein/Tfp pilus assembly protein PilF